MALADKLRKARETSVEAGGFKFTVRRPTDLEMIEMRGTVNGSQLLKFVLGWEGVKESDMLEGGDPHPLQFSREVAEEWLADRPDLFAKLAQGIIESYQAHAKQLEDAAKNSQPG